MSELINMINSRIKQEKKAECIGSIWSEKLNSVMTGKDTNDLRRICRECGVSMLDVLEKAKNNQIKVKDLM